MKIGIIGPVERAAAWEQHLAPHPAVKEVIITSDLAQVGDPDACIINDDSPDNLTHVIDAIQEGWHTFLVSRIPTQTEALNKVRRYAEESGVVVQFSHWPTLAQASQWMMSRISRPNTLMIDRTLNHQKMVDLSADLRGMWVDELAFCLRWIDSTIRHIDADQTVLSNGLTTQFHLFIRFDNSATASITLHTASVSGSEQHRRVASDREMVVDCNVGNQTIRVGRVNERNALVFDRKSFDPTKSAEMAAIQFIKSIQLGNPALFGPHHAYRLATVVERIDGILERG